MPCKRSYSPPLSTHFLHSFLCSKNQNPLKRKGGWMGVSQLLFLYVYIYIYTYIHTIFVSLMAKRNVEEEAVGEMGVGVKENQNTTAGSHHHHHHHPYSFNVSGPRKVSSPNWRDLINSSWKDGNYKRTVIACFVQAVYLLELDRQENKSEQTALAPKWWIPFKYKLIQTLIDERDRSIYGAILEWDRSAALSDYILLRPGGAPRAVLVLRGTLLKSPTMRRDIEDDLRFLAWESLRGSVRFKGALNALKLIADRYGSRNVCVAGHSLGAGFALQVGKALAKQSVFVEAHLFNPPSVSLAMSLKNVGEKAGFAWRRFRSMLPYSSETAQAQASGDDKGENANTNSGPQKWVPHLYVNNSDYICCYYTDPAGAVIEKENVRPATTEEAVAKLFVLSKEKQKFLEAHGLQQWWSDDLELQMVVNNSKLLSKQLKSLYALPASGQTQGKPR